MGSTEYLFRNLELLEEAIDTAIEDNTFRADDLEFTFAARVSGSSLIKRKLIWLRIGHKELVLGAWKAIERNLTTLANTLNPGLKKPEEWVTR